MTSGSTASWTNFFVSFLRYHLVPYQTLALFAFSITSAYNFFFLNYTWRKKKKKKVPKTVCIMGLEVWQSEWKYFLYLYGLIPSYGENNKFITSQTYWGLTDFINSRSNRSSITILPVRFLFLLCTSGKEKGRKN